MEITLITGEQGSGKNTKAYELIGFGKGFIRIGSNNLSNKESYQELLEYGENIIIFDEVNSNNLIEIKKIIDKNGVVIFRKPYSSVEKEYKISKLFILSQQDISEILKPYKLTHIKM